MGATMTVTPNDDNQAEPTATIQIATSSLTDTVIEGTLFLV